jgi:hypothetical protein
MEYITLRAIPFEYTWEEGECHLFQTPPPIEEKKISTHHHQNLLLKVPHYHQKKNNHKSNFHHRNTQSFALMIYQYTACKSLP